jgi:hypothetical protein
MDFRTISAELLNVTFLERINLILASSPVFATRLLKFDKEHTPPGPGIGRHILRIVLHLPETQLERTGYIWNFSELHPSSATTLSLLGQGTLLDASKCGSRVPTITRASCITFCPKTPWRQSTPTSNHQPDRLTQP